jgi:hypothetical protein
MHYKEENTEWLASINISTLNYVTKMTNSGVYLMRHLLMYGLASFEIENIYEKANQAYLRSASQQWLNKTTIFINKEYTEVQR